jgi:branched-chain amino acid transport system substrate-binding protein
MEMLRSHILAGIGATSVAALATPPPYAQLASIGLAAPFTGRAQRIGEALANGMRTAIDDYNQSLTSTLNVSYSLRTFDDQNLVANAILAAQFATGDSSIIGMVGHVSSECTLQAMQTYYAAQMPLIVPVCTDDRITLTNDRNVFRLQTKDSDEGAIFARAIIKELNPKVPFVFVQNGDYGADVANGFISAMADGKISAPYVQFGWDHPNFGTVVDGALAKTPDYCFLAGVVGDMGPVVAALRAKGYTGPIGASEGFFDGGTLQLGAAAEGMTISTSMPYLPLAPASIHARTIYEARYGQLTPVAAFGYAAAQIILTAAKRATASTRYQLLNAIAQGTGIDTVVGTFSFSGTGDPITPEIYFYTVRDGKFAYLRQAHASAFMVK